MGKKMAPGMQIYGIGRMLAGTKYNSEMFDISAHLDRTLTYGENRKNIQGMLGIQTRNKGMEHIHHQEAQRAAEHLRRQAVDRQTGQLQNEHNRLLDAMLHAHKPGKRISATGHVYYERRENRSDVDPERGL